MTLTEEQYRKWQQSLAETERRRNPHSPLQDEMKTTASSTPNASTALVAVLDLHKPQVGTEADGTLYCTECLDSRGDYDFWPCETVSVIQQAINPEET